jgi:hypothetical protein
MERGTEEDVRVQLPFAKHLLRVQERKAQSQNTDALSSFSA